MARKWTPKSTLKLHQRTGRRLADHKPDRRPCLGLGCGKVFDSMGAGNRFCERCTKRNESLLVYREGR